MFHDLDADGIQSKTYMIKQATGAQAQVKLAGVVLDKHGHLIVAANTQHTDNNTNISMLSI